jgi:sucrose-6-phosphate hydrolase SacC (GH32 family)
MAPPPDLTQLFPPKALAMAVLVIFCLALAAGCNDRPARSGVAVCCDSAADPVFLLSKLDDDDGDGNLFDEDFPTIDDEDDDIADHAWIRDDGGVYHLFFHTEDHGAGSHIEHYISRDLQNLQYIGVALSPEPGGWDSRALWAPHIVKAGDTYFMFYTGTDGPGNDPVTKQRIGLATSTDLMTWTRCPTNNCQGTTGDGCIYQCDESWTTWGDASGSYNQQCRDAFVLWDGDSGRWVMLATAKSKNKFGVVTVAYSNDLLQWTGAGFIDATRRLPVGVDGQTSGGQAENPFIVKHDGTHYLIFTDWLDPEDSVSVHSPRTQAQYATSTTLTADATGSLNWTYRGYIPDPGVNAIEVQRVRHDLWIMSQSIANDTSGDWERRRQLRLKCLVWRGGFDFDTSNFTAPCGGNRSAASPVAVETVGARPGDDE